MWCYHYLASWESSIPHITNLEKTKTQNLKYSFYWTHVTFAPPRNWKILSQIIIIWELSLVFWDMCFCDMYAFRKTSLGNSLAVQWLGLPSSHYWGTWVQFLVRELRFHKMCPPKSFYYHFIGVFRRNRGKLVSSAILNNNAKNFIEKNIQ